jgi:hypothetical protein
MKFDFNLSIYLKLAFRRSLDKFSQRKSDNSSYLNFQYSFNFSLSNKRLSRAQFMHSIKLKSICLKCFPYVNFNHYLLEIVMNLDQELDNYHILLNGRWYCPRLWKTSNNVRSRTWEIYIVWEIKIIIMTCSCVWLGKSTISSAI